MIQFPSMSLALMLSSSPAISAIEPTLTPDSALHWECITDSECEGIAPVGYTNAAPVAVHVSVFAIDWMANTMSGAGMKLSAIDFYTGETVEMNEFVLKLPHAGIYTLSGRNRRCKVEPKTFEFTETTRKVEVTAVCSGHG